MLIFNNQKYQTGNGINPVHSGISFKGQQKNDLSSWLAETPIAVRFPDLNDRRSYTCRGSLSHTQRETQPHKQITIHLLCKLDAASMTKPQPIFCFFGRFWIMLDGQTKLLLFNITNRTSASSERSPYRTVCVEWNHNANRLMKADIYRKTNNEAPEWQFDPMTVCYLGCKGPHNYPTGS